MKHRRQQFTLVELMAALIVTAIIIVAVSRFVTSTQSIYGRCRNDADLRDQAETIVGTIGALFQQRRYSDNPENASSYFASERIDDTNATLSFLVDGEFSWVPRGNGDQRFIGFFPNLSDNTLDLVVITDEAENFQQYFPPYSNVKSDSTASPPDEVANAMMYENLNNIAGESPNPQGANGRHAIRLTNDLLSFNVMLLDSDDNVIEVQHGDIYNSNPKSIWITLVLMSKNDRDKYARIKDPKDRVAFINKYGKSISRRL